MGITVISFFIFTSLWLRGLKTSRLNHHRPKQRTLKPDFKPKPVSPVIHLTIGHSELIIYVVILPSEVLAWDPNRVQVKSQDSQEAVVKVPHVAKAIQNRRKP